MWSADSPKQELIIHVGTDSSGGIPTAIYCVSPETPPGSVRISGTLTNTDKETKTVLTLTAANTSTKKKASLKVTVAGKLAPYYEDKQLAADKTHRAKVGLRLNSTKGSLEAVTKGGTKITQVNGEFASLDIGIIAANSVGSASVRAYVGITGTNPKFAAKTIEASAGSKKAGDIVWTVRVKGITAYTSAADAYVRYLLKNGTLPGGLAFLNYDEFADGERAEYRNMYALVVTDAAALASAGPGKTSLTVTARNYGAEADGRITVQSAVIERAGYMIAAVLPEITVTEPGQYDIEDIVLNENVPEGAKLIWLAFPDRATEDEDIAEFYDETGAEVEGVPAGHVVAVSAWLNAGVTYSPVIAVEKD